MSKKKVLFVATVDSHIKFFHIPYIEYFKEKGYETHVITNGIEEIPFCDVKHTVPMDKSPLNICNLIAYSKLKNIILKERFAIIHCHMPMAAALTRIAARRIRKEGTKVIYTAHGFHFYKGSSFKNWFIYYPVEKWCAKYTDYLITINNEDYQLASNNNFKASNVKLVNGVGVNLERFKIYTDEEKNELRVKYGYKKNDFIIMYVAELTNRKNHELLIKATEELKNKIENLRVIFIGKDSLDNKNQTLVADLRLEDTIEFLGLRQDIPQLLNICDLYVSTSKQEGLPINIIEAMACGVTVCATKIRGHVDLINHGVNGYLIQGFEKEAVVEEVEGIYENNKFIDPNIVKNKVEKYEVDKVLKSMKNIYKECEQEVNNNGK